ncbi:MAG TPA: hypothetical protein VMT03_20090 [Polyangia bacterium]|nr:hypothetical protein [Polyangia bacterium]
MALVIPTIWAALVWPPLGLGMGLFLALSSRERSIVTLASYPLAGMLGTSVGGLVTYFFTYERALLGGFWTSIVTALLGGLVFLGLAKALEESRRPASD